MLSIITCLLLSSILTYPVDVRDQECDHNLEKRSPMNVKACVVGAMMLTASALKTTAPRGWTLNNQHSRTALRMSSTPSDPTNNLANVKIIDDYVQNLESGMNKEDAIRTTIISNQPKSFVYDTDQTEIQVRKAIGHYDLLVSKAKEFILDSVTHPSSTSATENTEIEEWYEISKDFYKDDPEMLEELKRAKKEIETHPSEFLDGKSRQDLHKLHNQALEMYAKQKKDGVPTEKSVNSIMESDLTKDMNTAELKNLEYVLRSEIQQQEIWDSLNKTDKQKKKMNWNAAMKLVYDNEKEVRDSMNDLKSRIGPPTTQSINDHLFEIIFATYDDLTGKGVDSFTAFREVMNLNILGALDQTEKNLLGEDLRNHIKQVRLWGQEMQYLHTLEDSEELENLHNMEYAGEMQEHNPGDAHDKLFQETFDRFRDFNPLLASALLDGLDLKEKPFNWDNPENAFQ